MPVLPPSVGSGSRAGHLLRGVLNRLDDVLIAGAAAEVAFDAPTNLLLTGRRVVLEEVDARHDHAGRAEAALKAVLLPESALDRVKLAVLGQALDRLKIRPISLY